LLTAFLTENAKREKGISMADQENFFNWYKFRLTTKSRTKSIAKVPWISEAENS